MIDHRITLTHLNIRQSIAILLLKVILTDVILSVLIVGFYFLLVQGEQFNLVASSDTLLFLIVFAISGVIKIGLGIFIVLQWLNEYYEITPDSIIHKRGIIFRKSERYDLGKVRAMSVHDSFFGNICNYATVTLYDIRLNKYLDMYLIHNPNRYAKVIRTLRPSLEMKTDRIRIPGLKKRDSGDDYDDDQP